MPTLNVTEVPPAAGRGMTGIENVSFAKKAILVVLVHVTVIATTAPQDQPLLTKPVPGPDILAGRVKTVVCNPLEVVFPTLVRVMGS